MKKWLVEYLSCSKCGSDFKLDSRNESGEEVHEGFLSCSCSGYPVKSGIPRMLPKKLQNANKTMQSFGYEWKYFSKEYKIYPSQFEHWIHPIKKSQLKGKTVLDIGCGTGIHSRILESYGARVISVDISMAVDVVYQKSKGKNIAVVQADIADLPLKTKKFDYVFSIGSLHHMDDPKKGILSVKSALKKDGIFFLKVYSKEGNWFTMKIIEGIVKKVTLALPFWLLNFLCFVLVFPFSFIIWLFVFLGKISKSLRNLSFHNYFLAISGYSFMHKQNILFDILSAPVVHYYSGKEIKSLLNGMIIKSMLGSEVLSWRVIAENEKA